MKVAPTVSIVIATYNSAPFLENCLKSVLSQTYPYFEILVADGLSDDGTVDLIRKHEKSIAYWESAKDRGIYDAWNKIIPRAKGDWIFFLGSDDTLWDEKTLERVVPRLVEAKTDIVYGKVAITLPDGEILNFEGVPWEEARKKITHEMTIPHQGTFHRRRLFESRGLFDPSFRICGDYEFLLRELKDGSATFMPEVTVARMGFGGASSTLKNVKLIVDELDRARKMNGLPGVSPYILARRLRLNLRVGLSKIFGRKFSDRAADAYRRLVGKPTLWSRFHD